MAITTPSIQAPAIDATRRSIRHPLSIVAAVHRVTALLRAMPMRGQLGPIRERDIGRRSGARI